MNTLLVTLLAFAVSASAVGAQQRLIVDAQSGPDSDFASVAAALDAANPGDTIVVRAGMYSEPFLHITEGVAIVGEGTARVALTGVGSPSADAMTIEGIPADESFSLRGIDFAFNGILSPRRIRALNCAGSVNLQELGGVPDAQGLVGPLVIEFENCDRAFLQESFVRDGSVRFAGSRGSVVQCVFESGFSTLNSEVLVDRCTIRPGQPFFLTQPGMTAESSTIRLTRSSIFGSSVVSSVPAISTNPGTTITLDPTASLNPVGGAAPVEGGGSLINDELTSLNIDAELGLLRLDLQSVVGANYATLFSFPAPSTPSPWGEIWVDVAASISISSGVLTQRTDSCDIVVPANLTGLQIVLQTVTLTNDIGLSNGCVAVFL